MTRVRHPKAGTLMAVAWVAIAVAFGLMLWTSTRRLDDQTRHLCAHLLVVEQNQRAVLKALTSLRLSILGDPDTTGYQRAYARRSLDQLAAAQQRVDLIPCGSDQPK